MKINFTKLPTTDETIKISLDGGQSFTDYNVTDIHESGVPLSDNQDYEKIQIQTPTNILKNLNVFSSIKVEGGEGAGGSGGINKPSFIMDTDTYGFNFPECVTGLIFPKGITTITGFSNYDDSYNNALFPNLRAIVIPEGVTSIGDYAFENCSSLTSVTIPEGVTSIGDYAFENCSSLTSITIPNSVTSIGEYAFYNCSSLTSVTIPEGVTTIGNYAFADCSSLTSITIPNSVTSIGGSAFEGCSSLETQSPVVNESVPNGIYNYAIEQTGWFNVSLTEINQDSFAYLYVNNEKMLEMDVGNKCITLKLKDMDNITIKIDNYSGKNPNLNVEPPESSQEEFSICIYRIG